MKTLITILVVLLTAAEIMAQPQNDNCSYVPQIHALPFTDSGSTANAADDFTQCGGFEGSPDVIYMLWLDCPALVQISLCGSSFDTHLEVRSVDGGCPGSTVLACNDDACDVQSIVTVDAAAGVAYYVIVQGFDPADYGNYTISFTDASPPPVNDTCPGISFSELPFSHTGTTVGATQQTLSHAQRCPDVPFAGVHDVVYTFTPTSCYNATASVCGAGYNTVLYVRTGSNCPGSTIVACNDDFCNAQSEVSWTAVVNTTYYIVVAGFGGGAFQVCGNHTLNVTGTPTGCDACPGTTIYSLPFTSTGTTAGMNNDFNLACAGGSAADVIYRLSPLPNCQNVTVALCGSSFDTQLFVRTGGSCPGDNPVICNDDFCGALNRHSQLSFFANIGQEYWIIIGGFSGAAGDYALSVTSEVAYQSNDQCAGARPITALPYTDSGNTICATEHFSPACSVFSNAPDVFYSMTLPCATAVTASLCGSGYDTMLEIRRDGACPGSSLVACNDDFCGTFGHRSQITFNAEAGVTYYLIVDGYSASSYGFYELSVTSPTDAPQHVVIQPVGNTVVLTWDAACGATQYDIYRATTPNVAIIPANHIGIAFGGATSFTDAVSNDINAKYFYAVTANYPALAAREDTEVKMSPAMKEPVAK